MCMTFPPIFLKNLKGFFVVFFWGGRGGCHPSREQKKSKSEGEERGKNNTIFFFTRQESCMKIAFPWLMLKARCFPNSLFQREGDLGTNSSPVNSFAVTRLIRNSPNKSN